MYSKPMVISAMIFQTGIISIIKICYHKEIVSRSLLLVGKD